MHTLRNIDNRIYYRISILLIVFSTLCLLGGFILVQIEYTNNLGYKYLQTQCYQDAQIIDDEMIEIIGLTNMLADETLELIDSLNTLNDEQNIEELAECIATIAHNSMDNFDFIKSSYLRFSPDLTSPTAGFYYIRNENIISKVSTTDLSLYDTSEIDLVGWYHLPIDYGQAMWIEPTRNRLFNTYTIAYVVPIFIGSTPVGVVGMDIDMNSVIEKVNNISILNKGYSYLISPSEEIIGKTPPTESQKYSSSVYRLQNNMLFYEVVPSKEIYPIMFSPIFWILVSIEIFNIICVAVTTFIRNKTDLFTHESHRHRNTSLSITILSICVIIVFAIQIVFTLYQEGYFFKGNPISNYNNHFDRTLLVTGDIDFEPHSFLDSNGKAVGKDIDVITEVGNRLGYNVQVDLMPWSDANSAVENGNYDILLGFEILSNRFNEELISSRVTDDDSFVIYGKRPVSSIMDILGRRIATISGADQIDTYGLEKNAEVFDLYTDELWSLENGKNDYAIVRKSVGDALIKKMGFSDIFQVYELIESTLGLGVKPTNTELLSQLNIVLNEMDNDGTLDAINEYWNYKYDGPKSFFAVFRENIMTYICSIIIICILLVIILYMRMRNKNNELQIASEKDGLTGITNRGSGENEVKKLLSVGKTGMFCVFDVDKFKSINDNYGHAIGDKVLIEIAKCMQRSFRDRDIFFRLGGDEFAAYAVGVIDEESGSKVILRLFDQIKQINIPEMNGAPINISLGASFYTGDDDDNFKKIYERADHGAYNCKKVPGCSYGFIHK